MATTTNAKTQSLNIIVFGETGTGKSAVINMLFDQDIVRSSNSAVGCTTSTKWNERAIPGYTGIKIRIADTIGLSESSEGSVETKDAFVQLVKTLYEMEDGINLLICVARRGRLSSQAFKSNYTVFVEEICERRVPCLLVITHCEEDDTLDSFWNANKEIVSKTLKFNFIDGVSVSTKKTIGRYQNLDNYKLSRNNLITAIKTHALKKPWKMDSIPRTVGVFFKKIWNSIAEKLGFNGIVGLRRDLVLMFRTLGCDERSAIAEANNLYEILQTR